MKTASQPATGASDFSLPFWEKLDDSAFEECCTALLNAHPIVLTDNGPVRTLDAERLLSGSSQGGIDIRAKTEKGEVWVFQCKRVQSFARNQVEEAIRRAESGFPGVDRYVLVTTCGLTNRAREPLDGRPKWSWWDAGRLTTLVANLEPTEAGIHLVYRFFGKDWMTRLFPWGDVPYLEWQSFFRTDLDESRRHFHHRNRFLGDSPALRRLLEFARSGAGRALILSAAGGQGKSRLLLELARNPDLPNQGVRVRFLHPGSRGLSDADRDRLRREKDLLLVVDDGHRMRETVEDVARAAAESESVRLLVATRPHAVADLRSRLHRAGYAERIESEDVTLPRWTAENLEELAKLALGSADALHAPRLAALADGCPLLVILGAEAVRQHRLPEAVASTAEFQERVLKGLPAAFLESVDPSRRERVDRVMRLLALVGPVPKGGRFEELGARVLEVRALDVDEDVKALVAGQLAVVNREGTRIYPDLLADALVLEECGRRGGVPSLLVDSTVERFDAMAFPSLLSNLAQADWHVSAEASPDVISAFARVWQVFHERFRGATASERGRLLDQWAPISGFQPGRTLELVDELLAAGDLSLGDRVPALLEPLVVWHSEWAESALERLWQLAAKGRERSSFPGSDPIGAIARAASFSFEKPRSASESVLAWIEKTLRKAEGRARIEAQPDILAALLKPFFARIAERHWNTGRKWHLQTLPVAASPTRGWRRRALQLVDESLGIEKPAVARSALSVLADALAPCPDLGGEMRDGAVLSEWETDRLEALDVARRAGARFRDAPVLLLLLRRSLRRHLTGKWNEGFANATLQAMGDIPDTFELRLLRVLSGTAHEELGHERLTDEAGDWDAVERAWREFAREVVREARDRWGSGRELCVALDRWIAELNAAGVPVQGDFFFESLLGLDPIAARQVLDEIVHFQSARLDGFCAPVWEVLAQHAHEIYADRLQSIPRLEPPRPSLWWALVAMLASRHRRGISMSAEEQRAVEAMARRADRDFAMTLASCLGWNFATEANWAIDVLTALPTGTEHPVDRVLGALAAFCRVAPDRIDAGRVSRCLKRHQGAPLAFDGELDHDLARIAAVFPREVYQAVRDGIDQDLPCQAWERRALRAGGVRLGRISDAAFLEGELREQWEKAVAAEPASSRRHNRLQLCRTLIGAGSDPAAEVRRLLDACRDSREVVALAEFLAPLGSEFALRDADSSVRLLERAEAMGVTEAVRQQLVSSASRGGVWTDGFPDAGSAWRLERARELARSFASNTVAGPMYQEILRLQADEHRMFRRSFSEDQEGFA